MNIKEDKLRIFCEKALVYSGMDSNDSRIMSDVLVTTDMWGIFSHGVKNLYGYICKAEAGGVSFSNKPFIEKQDNAATVINGNNTMGYISSVMAMNIACELAKVYNIAIVFVKNSSHFGATGYYSNIAASKGMIGITLSNVDKKMTIPGARGMVMGHNPFSLAAPAESFPSVILDSSSSNVASLKVLTAKKTGMPIPNTWISDSDGLPTNDPSHYPEEGALLPLGEYKGFGIAIFIEILTSILLDCPRSTQKEVYSWLFDLDKPNNICHCFIVIDPSFVIGDTSLSARVEKIISELHQAPLAKGNSRITIPGERRWERYFQAKISGINLPDDVVEKIEEVSKKVGISL